MTFTKTLLAGAALCALCSAPALARQAPNVHLQGLDGARAKITANHSKSTASPDAKSFTTTVTFSGTIPEASFYKTPTLLWAEAWINNSTCVEPPNQKFTTQKTTANAKISGGTVTGSTTSCTTSTFTFYGPVYDLKSKTATSDTFTSKLVAKHASGYNLTLNATTNLTISH